MSLRGGTGGADLYFGQAVSRPSEVMRAKVKRHRERSERWLRMDPMGDWMDHGAGEVFRANRGWIARAVSGVPQVLDGLPRENVSPAPAGYAALKLFDK